MAKPIRPRANNHHWSVGTISLRERGRARLYWTPDPRHSPVLRQLHGGEVVEFVPEIKYGHWVIVRIEHQLGWVNYHEVHITEHTAPEPEPIPEPEPVDPLDFLREDKIETGPLSTEADMADLLEVVEDENPTEPMRPVFPMEKLDRRRRTQTTEMRPASPRRPRKRKPSTETQTAEMRPANHDSALNKLQQGTENADDNDSVNVSVGDLKRLIQHISGLRDVLSNVLGRDED